MGENQCPDCGRPVATNAHSQLIPEGEGTWLCWHRNGCGQGEGVVDRLSARIAELEEELSTRTSDLAGLDVAYNGLKAEIAELEAKLVAEEARSYRLEIERDTLLRAAAAKADEGDDWGNEYAAVVQFKRERNEARRERDAMSERMEWTVLDNAKQRMTVDDQAKTIRELREGIEAAAEKASTSEGRCVPAPRMLESTPPRGGGQA